jgi:hypothetical protein
MSLDRAKLRAEAAECLGQDKSAGELVDCVTAHFPDVEVYREDEDLVIRGAGRFLVVRRAGPDRFRISENVAVPSTNLVEVDGTEVSLDALINEIDALVK